jgi:NAD(P)-dependent dehydrogenase (short-subunit alcohol dehydrogenase family)
VDPHKAEVVVITGARAGVGRATAQAFARRGACIGLLARGEEELEAAKREVEALGGQAVAIPTDVADPEQVERAAAVVEATFGPIDIWINNAMTTILAPFIEISPADFKRATEVTYLGYVYGTMAALKRMLPRNRGTIVQVGSALAYRSIPLQSPYCGAKFAIRGFTDSLRSELIHDSSHVHVTMVQMPALNTPQFEWCKTRLPRHPQPVPPIFQPEVAAQAIVWAAHHRRREIYVGFPSLRAIWANKFIPGLLDHYLAHIGYRGQQSNEAVAPNRPDNLWQPVPGHFGAHGRFDKWTRGHSLQLWLSLHQGWSALAALGALILVALLVAGGHALG